MYSRFNALPNYDLEEIKGSTVAVVGLGATGSVIAENLARHGIKLVLIDRDYLEMNDLYSSNLYDKEQCEKALPKAKAAESKLSSITKVEAHVTDLAEDNKQILDSDLIMDGTDNIETRYLIGEYSKDNCVPWIYTSALGERGFSMFIEEKCFKCLFDRIRPKDSCESNGIMREISSIAGSKSSLKAVKYLSGVEVKEKLEIIPEMDAYDVGECTCEGLELKTSQVCGENKFQVHGNRKPSSFSGEEIVSNEYLRRIRIEGSQVTIFNSGRAIIEAESLERAEELYEKSSDI